jgi:NitT/TauT family transport system permease protein
VSAIPHIHMGIRLKRWAIRRWNLELLLWFVSISTAAIVWQFAKAWNIPYLNALPSITDVIAGAHDLVTSPKYVEAWGLSLRRITLGFLAAQVVGIPLGLAMAMSRRTFYITFPIVEMLRPIPPVAWIPVAIIFWPTRELSVVAIVFLGAFWIVLLNTIGGASNIDAALKRAALSLGSKPHHVFWRIILPAAVPSIVTGMAVGMGISWEMVVASEMIAGNNGLGYLLWQSFEINAIDQVIVCMVSIGIAGYVSSAIIRAVGQLVTPWQRLF